MIDFLLIHVWVLEIMILKDKAILLKLTITLIQILSISLVIYVLKRIKIIIHFCQ